MSSSKIISLAWNDHHNMFKHIFVKFLESSTLVDCIISAEGQSLKAHKIVLAACSNYFEVLFSRENMKNPITFLEDIKFQHLKMLLDFMYSGEVKLPQDQFEDFLDAAQSLQIKGLEEEYKKYDIRNIVKKSKFGNNSSMHSPEATFTQMQINHSTMNEDETGLSLSISKLSVNCENHSQHQIRNTTSTFLTPVAQTSSKLHAAKLNKRDISGVKIRMESEFQTLLPRNNNSACLINAENLEETVVLNSNITVAEMTPRVMLEQEKISSVSIFTNEIHHNSAQSLPLKRFLRRRISQVDASTEPVVIGITTSEEVTNFISSPAPPKQFQSNSYVSCCEKVSRKPDKLKTCVQKCKRKSAHLCGDCKKSFSSSSGLKIHQNLTHKSRHNITLKECLEVLKWPMHFRVQQNVHKVTLPFICEYCQRAFLKMKQLKRHKHIHKAG